MYRSNFSTGVRASIVSVLSAAATVAQAEPASQEQIIVTATRVPQPIEEVLAPSIVITREQLENNAVADVSDALRFNAGIDVARTGGIGQPTSIFIRGAESNHTLVLIDGVRINPGTVGSAQIQNIPPDLIERIEVIKGPRSSLYGSDAIGGVINIITRAPTNSGVAGEVRSGWGNYNTQKASGLIEAGNETISGGISAASVYSEGFPALQTSNVDNGYDNLAISANARAKLGPVNTTIRYMQSEGTASYLAFGGAFRDQDFLNRVLAATVSATPFTRWETKLTASYTEDLIEQNQPVNVVDKDFLETRRYIGDWQNTIAITDVNRVVAGAMFSTEQALTRAFSTFDVNTDVLNLYLQDQFTIGRHAVVVAGGFTDHEYSGDHVTWNAEYGLSLWTGSKVIASAGTAFRAPDATDRFGFGGNPDLKPEVSENYELAFRQDLSANQSVQVSAFQNEIDDLVTYDNATDRVYNIDSARIRGAELSYEISGNTWRFHAEANYQDPMDLSTDTRLLRRARKSFSAGYQQQFGPIEVGTDISLVGSRRDFGNQELESYSLVNLHANYDVTEDLKLLVQVENLFNEQYEVANGYNTADRGVFVSLKYGTP
jgi:vitamin B12 transporter